MSLATENPPPQRQPLTPGQVDIWLQQSARPHSVQYNISLSYFIPLALDVASFVRAVDWVFAHTDALYARLVPGAGDAPEMLFDPGHAPKCEFIDFSAEDDPQQARDAWLDHRARQPFPLFGDGFARAALIKTGEHSFCYASEFFHLVVDGAGSAVVFQRVARAYTAFRAGREPTGPDDSYATYLQSHRDESIRESSLAFWQSMLAKPLPMLPPAYALTEGEDELASACVRFSLPRPLADRLTQQAAASNATFFHTLILAATYLLAKQYGLDAPALNLPVLNRDKTHKESIGFFVESRPLPIPLDEHATMADNLQAIARRTRELFRHYRTPAAELTRLYHAAGHAGIPLGITALSYITQQFAADIEGHRIAMHNRTPVQQSAPFVFYVFDSDPTQDATIELSYRLSHADRAMAELLARRLLHLLEGIAREPGALLGDLDPLPPGERQQIDAWLHREAEYAAAPHLVIDDILAQAQRHPDAVAVESGSVCLTYRQCLAQAQAIARTLAEDHGVNPGARVALLLPRGGDLVASQLGVMLAGATFVPIDPHGPQIRSREISQDAGAKCLLTTSALADKARAILDEVIEVDALAAGTAPFLSRCAPAQIAYLLYTSGSTGRPKGVEISQQTLADHCASWLRTIPMREGRERSLHFFSPAFDASIETVFPTLLLGNTIVAAPHPQWSVYEFPGEIVERRITHMFLPPAYLLELLKHLRDEPGRLAGHQVRVCMAGGDVMHAETAPLFEAAFGPGVTLANVYGPTETTVTATIFQPPPGYRTAPGESIPIGRPHAGRSLRIVDPRGRDVPIGTEGELLIGGLGLARGYRNLPEETAARFVTFADGRRYYRSGDVVRLRPNGVLVFRRRLDRQVQIRGFRIEPGEIEACLHTHPAVNECAVEVRCDSEGRNPALHAFVSPLSGANLTARALREHLLARLPDYMVPVITRLERLPKNNSGKIDRQALFGLFPTGQAPTGEPDSAAAPQGPVQQFLALLWHQTLGVNITDVHGDFFEQGGHSLLAAKLIVGINRAFRVEYPIAEFFAHPTITATAGGLERLVGDQARLEKMAAVRLELASLSPEQIRDRLKQSRPQPP